MQLDVRGKACPEPVVLAIKALGERRDGEALEVLADNGAPVENLKRMAAQKGLECAVEERDGYCALFVGAGAKAASAAPACASGGLGDLGGAVIAVGADQLGRGSEELGRALMKSFLYAVARLETPPKTMIFFNGGARLTVSGSASLEDMMELERRGTEIITCGTCLDYYGIKDKLAVGGITNMYRIAETLCGGERVVAL